MKIIVSAISVLAIIVASLYDNNYFVQPNTLVWSDSLKLRWSNFGGLELPGEPLDLQTTLKETEHISFHAVAVTDIICSKTTNGYDVKAVFYTGKSSYKMYFDTVRLISYKLRHEHYHFHITELFARHIRRDLAMTPRPTPYDVDALYDKHVASLDSATAAYDKFTRHANIIENQRRAEQVIDSLLIATNAYKSTVVISPQ